MQIDEAILQEMADTVVATVHPDAVVLYGSQARGEARPDSDVDLLVFVPGQGEERIPRRRLSGDLYRALAKFPVTKDVMVFTSGERDRWKDDLNHCIGRGLREGKILYERD